MCELAPSAHRTIRNQDDTRHPSGLGRFFQLILLTARRVRKPSDAFMKKSPRGLSKAIVFVARATVFVACATVFVACTTIISLGRFDLEIIGSVNHP